MGIIRELLTMVFGGGRNVIAETAEVFRENAEAGAERSLTLRQEALAQMASEFARDQKGGFDRFMDGVNRLPRPMLALGTLGLFVAAMVDPLWFAQRMQGIALVPEPLWWLLGVIVSFYFGARHQVKSQQFQRDLAQSLTRAPDVARNISTLRNLRATTPGVAQADQVVAAVDPSDNPALADWRALRA